MVPLFYPKYILCFCPSKRKMAPKFFKCCIYKEILPNTCSKMLPIANCGYSKVSDKCEGL